jgi:valyl-tRNA synthetase
VLEATLRLAHPIMPFITEEIWQAVKELAGAEGDTIMLQPFPVADDSRIDAQAETDIEWLKGVITGVRNIRGEMKIPPSQELDLLFAHGNADDKRRMDENAAFLKKLAKLSSLTWLDNPEQAPMSATALVGKMEVLVPMAGLIDKDAELSRLQKELDRLSGEIKRVEGKLANEKFVANAPEAVVAKEREKIAAAQESYAKLKEQYAKIEAL